MSLRKLVGGSLLVSGTAIGAGMLALPIATGIGGFVPSVVFFLACWAFMTFTGLLFLEICLWMPHDSNIVSMASHLLGKRGKFLSWVLYLFLFYCLTIAYVAGGGGIMYQFLGNTLSIGQNMILFTLLFSPFIFIGAHAVDRVNALLMVGLIGSYVVFIFFGVPHIEVAKLNRFEWSQGLMALPLIFTSFSYQGIVPSLTHYFKRDAALIRKAIIIGSSVPFFVYVIWQLLILGIVPIEGANGLLEAKAKGQSAIMPLRYFVQSPFLLQTGQVFSFFAIATSFLGVTLGLFDFLADGLKMKKTGGHKWLLFGLVFLPPTVIALLNPDIFIEALGYAGGIGCALLLGLFPVLMVWAGRYRKGLSLKHTQLFGGKPLLVVMVLFVIFELAIELIQEFSRI